MRRVEVHPLWVTRAGRFALDPLVAFAAFAACVAFVGGCSGSAKHDGVGLGGDASAGDDGASNTDAATRFALDAASDAPAIDAAPVCGSDSLDWRGCPCDTVGATRPCFTGDKSNRSVGACKDGSQTCAASGEFKTWGACTGSVLPSKEVCTDSLDHDCNGLVGCKDPSCATDPACNTACTEGAIRDCYTGPAGTLGVGVCKAGKQKCEGGAWTTACVGEVLPGPQNCSDAIDHACNHLPGCLNLFACITDPNCTNKCKMPLDPGCVCQTGDGDTATCPKGMHSTGDPFTGGTECCPCTASDCGQPNCCGEDVCAGNASCGTFTCAPLPASCGGKVSADCDDFPEDCDEPCCECYGDCSSTTP
jgi:hypothetical protein